MKAESLVKQMYRQKCVTKYHKCIAERIMGHGESIENIKRLKFTWVLTIQLILGFF